MLQGYERGKTMSQCNNSKTLRTERIQEKLSLFDERNRRDGECSSTTSMDGGEEEEHAITGDLSSTGYALVVCLSIRE